LQNRLQAAAGAVIAMVGAHEDISSRAMRRIVPANVSKLEPAPLV
jgi:hypothetical protein